MRFDSIKILQKAPGSVSMMQQCLIATITIENRFSPNPSLTLDSQQGGYLHLATTAPGPKPIFIRRGYRKRTLSYINSQGYIGRPQYYMLQALKYHYTKDP